MTRICLLVMSYLFLHFISLGQSVEKNPIVDKTQIDVVYNQYIQDGNSSAITGGIGTEQLTIYGPGVKIKRNWQQHALSVHMGADIISSASTDNIDYIKSSASILDSRSYINTNYGYTFSEKELRINGGLACSIESDYFSLGGRIGMTKTDSKNLAQYSIDFQAYKDDLRWGRLTQGIWRPVKLIYPYELRHTDWFTTHERYSFNLRFGYNKAINKRSMFGIYPVITYQKGLLSTPFHRVYFNDETVHVEQLPNQRFKVSLGLQWNQYVGNHFVLKNSINPYFDNWGIRSINVKHETAFKYGANWTFLPNIRWSIQKGSRYYAPYLEHPTDALIFTSDADLSSYQTFDVGLGIRWTPLQHVEKRNHINSILIRYYYLHRTNGLKGHMFSCVIQLERIAKNSWH